jgi:cell division protein FtsW
MIYSSTGVDAALGPTGSAFDGVVDQLGWAIAGLVALVVIGRLDYRYLRTFSVLGFLIGLGLLSLLHLPAIGPIQPLETGGSVRWLRIGSLPSFQPAELAKLALVVFLAHWLTSRGREVGSPWRVTIPFVVFAGSYAGLVITEPDLGTTGVIALTAATMWFVAGASLWQLALLIPAGVVAVAAYVLMNPYQLERIHTFLDPWASASSGGYQTVQGLYALALGGLSGAGLGQSGQPGGLTVPNADNDFIFAVIGQELGLPGGLTVIVLFLVLAVRGIRVALGAPDTFGALVALGITAWLSSQAFINIGVVVNLLPLTGIPLPFVSAGGTSLMVSLTAVGILLSISRETLPRGAVTHEDPDRGRRHGWPHLPRPGRRATSAG